MGPDLHGVGDHAVSTESLEVACFRVANHSGTVKRAVFTVRTREKTELSVLHLYSD
jgi:hypothetical protein